MVYHVSDKLSSKLIDRCQIEDFEDNRHEGKVNGKIRAIGQYTRMPLEREWMYFSLESREHMTVLDEMRFKEKLECGGM